MGYTLDIVLVAVCVAFVAIGAHRGFIRSAAHFLGAVVGSQPGGPAGRAPPPSGCFDTLFRPGLVRAHRGISGKPWQLAIPTPRCRGCFASLPDFILRALEQAGVTAASVTEALAGQSGQAADLIADALAPVFVGFLKVLAVIVLFCLFMIVVRIVANLLATVFHLPYPARRGRPAGRRVRPAAGGDFHLDLSWRRCSVHPHAGRRTPKPRWKQPCANPTWPGWWSTGTPWGIMFQ